MKQSSNAVVKVGGSLIDRIPLLIRQIDTWAAARHQSILIVPGGGIFANSIRTFQESFGISDNAAHWMAVLAMEQYAYYILDRIDIRFIDNLDEFKPGASLLLPYELLKRDDHGLPHSWDVTSDTIAAWVAQRTSSRLVKATDVDGICISGELQSRISSNELMGMEKTCVDTALPGFLTRYSMDCIVVNGKYPDRVLAALAGETAISTVIIGRARFKPV